LTLFVLESIDELAEPRLFSAFGVEFVRTRLAWLNIPLMAAVGVAVALLVAPVDGSAGTVAAGLAYGALIIVASLAHSLGHVFSSRLASAPVEYVRLSATVATMRYKDSSLLSGRVHVLRALGGPVANLALGVSALLLSVALLDSHLLRFFGAVNLLFGAMALSPIPSLDGAVIFRQLFGRSP
jgi:hypothetical protein